MNPRRKFLKHLAGASLGALFLPLKGRVGEDFPNVDQNFRGMGTLDGWDWVREQFPLMAEMHYLNAGTRGPQPFGVLETMESTNRYFAETGIYKELTSVRKGMAELLGVGDDEFAFTRNATEGINVIAASLKLNKGDEVIMTSHEHVGNALPWLNRMRRSEIQIRAFEPAMTARENMRRIKALVTKKTRAIAIPHVTSPTGIVMPIKEISAYAAQHGLYSFFDGAQAAGHIQVDLKDINCDFYAGCFHKWYLGPEGTGFLYIKKGRLDHLDPIHVGAYSDTGWEIAPDRIRMDAFVDSARMFEYGTHSEALAKGAVKAVEFMHALGMEKVEARCRYLSDYLRERLLKFGDAIQILTPKEKDSHAGILGFRLNGRSSHDFFNYARVNKYRIRFVPESGLNSLRVSTHIYNNEDEMDGFAEVLKEFMAKY